MNTHYVHSDADITARTEYHITRQIPLFKRVDVETGTYGGEVCEGISVFPDADAPEAGGNHLEGDHGRGSASLISEFLSACLSR